MPINPPAKPAPKMPSSRIEENIESSESANQFTMSVRISRSRPKFMVINPETARNPRKAAWARAIILKAFNEIPTRNAPVAPSRNTANPFSP